MGDQHVFQIDQKKISPKKSWHGNTRFALGNTAPYHWLCSLLVRFGLRQVVLYVIAGSLNFAAVGGII